MSDTKASGGIGFTGLLLLLFIALKLCGVIDWSWWWVLSPVWIMVGAVIAFIGAFACIAAAVEVWKARKKG